MSINWRLVNKLRYVCAVEYYVAVKRNETELCLLPRNNLQDILLSEKSKMEDRCVV